MDSITMTKPKPKTFSQWNELRKANPRQYYSPRVQTQVLKDAQSLGSEVFYSKQPPSQDTSDVDQAISTLERFISEGGNSND